MADVYVAPNPFTYATRSDKRLLEFLSLPAWDGELGIEAREREILSRHIPETHLLRADNLDDIVENRDRFVFKPIRSHASRGFLPSARVGRSRLAAAGAEGRRLRRPEEGGTAAYPSRRRLLRVGGSARVGVPG